MKKAYSLTFALLLLLSVKAQYTSLNNQELGKLKTLIHTDAEVKELYASFERNAAQALNATPHPIDTITTEGRLKGDPKKTATALALQDMHKIYSLAIVHRINGDKSYLQKATAFLLAWASVNRSKGDPIDDTNLDDAIEGYDLIKTSLSAADNQAITQWWRQVVNAERDTLLRHPNRTTSFNNWNSHRLKVIGEIAWAIGDTAYQQFTLRELKKQIARNLYSDGSGFDFHERDALHYHVYDLDPLLSLSILIKRATGINFYVYVSETQSSIKKSTEWLTPFVTGEKTHGEFAHSKVKFDSLRAANNEPGYKAGTIWNPTAGYKTLGLAAYFDPQYNRVLKTVTKSDKTYPGWQQVLNKVML